MNLDIDVVSDVLQIAIVLVNIMGVIFTTGLFRLVYIRMQTLPEKKRVRVASNRLMRCILSRILFYWSNIGFLYWDNDMEIPKVSYLVLVTVTLTVITYYDYKAEKFMRESLYGT